MLEHFRFDPKVTLDDGEATAVLPGFGVLGFGATFEEAMEDLAGNLRDYADRFFEKAAFYMETDRSEHAPWLLRFALTPQEQQLELLYADSERAVRAARLS